MDKRIRDYCKHICKAHIEVLRTDHRAHVKYWDLPAMATICHDKNYIQFEKGYSHTPKWTKWHTILKRELKRVGYIGGYSYNGGGYIIGNCAEQHSGNNYMNRYRESRLEELYFTEAVRPRTMEVFPYC